MGLKEIVLTKSINVFHVSIGSCNNCDIEILDCLTPRFDLERFGIVLCGSIRHADVMLCTGSANRQTVPVIKRLYEQMPKPGFVVAIGECALSRGMYMPSYNCPMPLDKVIPVDVYIPGCPPRPEALLDGIIKLQKKIMKQKFRINKDHK